jgi:DNA-directed RNA polymerase beta' subunit
MKTLKRLLTSEEIEDVLSVITSSSIRQPLEVEQYILNARETVRNQLLGLEMYPEVLPAFKAEIKKQYFDSLLQPGEMVGIIAASSIGEQNTQASLNSFHQSGAFKANLTGGLARMSELMNATSNTKTPSLTIFFNKQVKQDLEVIRSLAFTKLIYMDIDSLLDRLEIVDSSQPSFQLDKWYEFFNTFEGDHSSHGSTWVLQLYLNPKKLWKHQITLRTIVKKINESLECGSKIYFAYSHESLGRLDLWVKDDIPPLSTVLNLNTTSKLSGLITEETKMQYYINKVILPKILFIQVSGVLGLLDCYYTEVKKEWRVDTKGGKLKELLAVSCVDGTRCKSNDMHEIAELFGIEATKQMLREEFNLLSKVNLRHLELLIDSMTFSGTIQRVTRNGIDRKQVGTIAKASFEQPLENFLISASYGDKDPLKGVSASITVGKLAEIGTGFMELIDKNKYSGVVNQVAAAIDEEEVEETIDIEELVEEEEEDEMEEEEELEDDTQFIDM